MKWPDDDTNCLLADPSTTCACSCGGRYHGEVRAGMPPDPPLAVAWWACPECGAGAGKFCDVPGGQHEARSDHARREWWGPKIYAEKMAAAL